MNLPRLYHTLRHCRREQLLGQVVHRLRGHRTIPVHTAPAFPGCADAAWSPPAPLVGSNTAAALIAGRFSFVNREAAIGWPPNWMVQDQPMLWRYNLHYLDWIWALELPEAQTAMQHWIEQNPIDSSGVGWDPYPVSLRLINACLYFFQRHQVALSADLTFRDSLWESLWLHAAFLRRNLEVRLLGNHLLENLVALEVFARCFQGPENPLRDRLEQELDEQLLEDGMHFERSPMYHLRVLYLLEILVGLGRKDLVERLQAARRAASMLTHPDDEVALFNDGAFDIYPGVSASDATGAWSLPDAGYYGWRDATNYLICDAGPIGPDYIPGHAHADLLSFEWSIRGKRFIVDSGVFDYVPGDMRDYCRSTAAHNTLEINGENQVECWGVFRVARRGYPKVDRWLPQESSFELSASHNGYQRLHRSLIHRRTFSFSASEELVIQDKVESKTACSIISRIHFHPDWWIDEIDGGTAIIRSDEQSVRVISNGEGALTREKSWYCPEFHRRFENDCLVFKGQGPCNWTTAFHVLREV